MSEEAEVVTVGSLTIDHARHTVSVDGAIIDLTAKEFDLLSYLAARAPGGRASSANRRLTVFRRFYRYLVRIGQRDADPTLAIRSAKQPERFPYALSEAQVSALLAAPDASTVLGLRDAAMLETLYATGLRVSELIGLRTIDLG